MAITYFGRAETPADNGTNSLSVIISPIASMAAGDLLVVFASTRTTGGSITRSGNAGQVWTALNGGASWGTTNLTVVGYWCRFNGNWDTGIEGSDAVSIATTGTGLTCVRVAYRPSIGSNTWAEDVALANTAFAAPSSPFTVTRAGQTAIADSTVAIAGWATTDDNTWNALSGTGWVTPGAVEQVRNLAGQDTSMALAHRIATAAGASGNVSKNQATLGGDAGVSWIVTFKEVAGVPNVNGTFTLAGGGTGSFTGTKAASAAHTLAGGGTGVVTGRKEASTTFTLAGGGVLSHTGAKNVAGYVTWDVHKWDEGLWQAEIIERTGTFVLAGGGTLAVTASKGGRATFTAAGGGTGSATAQKGGRIALTVAGGGGGTATAAKGARVNALLSGGGTGTATARKGSLTTLTLAGGGTGSFTGGQNETHSGTFTLAGGGVLTSTGLKAGRVTLVLAGGGTVAASVRKGGSAAITLPGGGTGAATGFKGGRIVLTLAGGGAGTFTGSGTLSPDTHSGTFTLAGGGGVYHRGTMLWEEPLLYFTPLAPTAALGATVNVTVWCFSGDALVDPVWCEMRVQHPLGHWSRATLTKQSLGRYTAAFVADDEGEWTVLVESRDPLPYTISTSVLVA